MDTTTNVYDVYFVPSDNVKPTITFGDYSHNEVYSGETFKNTISVSDNYGVQSVSIPNDSGIRVSISNNNTQVSGTAPNVTSVTNKSVKVTAIDKSNNQIIEQFNVLLKPLKDKYRLTTSSTNQHPVRLNNIQNGATLSPAERQSVIDSVSVTNIAPRRSYITEPANEVQSKEVSNVIRPRNDATVTVTVTYKDGTINQISVPVKHVLPEVVSVPRYTVQGHNFPQDNGAAPRDFF